MKTALRCLVLPALLSFFPLGCRSSGGAGEVPCICGTPEADVQGCPHRDCLAGKRNPDNAACVCAGLSIPR